MFKWQSIFDGAPERRLQSDVTLFRREDPVEFVYLVRSGQIALERPMADAEASLFADAYHCDANVRQTAVVARLPKAALIAKLRQTPQVALGLIECNAHEIQAQRARIEILRMRRVSDRLDAWLDLFGEPAKGEWVRVADGIGVSPSALYRELGHRRLPSRN